ncbi:MAG TPA: hypothetical protein VF190_03580 [Rhodothermales bacterium]
MRRFAFVPFLLIAVAAHAQPRVHPTGVNVNATGATVVFLSYGGLQDYVPDEAVWCGALIPALPAIGERCDPATIFGHLPLRHDLSTSSGTGGMTDVMTIPPSVARRAYQSAETGADSRFFYVRRFVHAFGGAPDVYVAVTCRLTGGGARTPFALLDVQMAFSVDEAVLTAAPGSVLPPLSAEISYNGTGQLRGRWEIVRPGEDPPTERDLLTEATLPLEERGLQRRYTEVSRFSVFLPPSSGARFILPGPRPEDLPTDVEGLYQVLLRIEATDDKEGDSDLSAVGAGTEVVHSGAVAGFPIPPLRYFVSGGAAPRFIPAALQLLPGDSGGETLDLSWTGVPHATLYRLEILGDDGERIHEALLPSSIATYRTPPWIRDRSMETPLSWRVTALNSEGRVLAVSSLRAVRALE